jgi:multiple sugar transport system ATP-binding protein
MDEPLSNLDALLRVQTRTQIASLQRRLRTTTVYVTHDQVEAMTLGHRVAVLDKGRLQQCDAPDALFDRPANVFVAGFIGSPAMNLLTSKAVGGKIELGPFRLALSAAQQHALTTSEVIIGVRPEDFAVVAPEDGVPGQVELVEELGPDAYAYLTTGLAARSTVITVRTQGRHGPARGTTVGLAPSGATFHLFDAGTGMRLPDSGMSPWLRTGDPDR